MDGKDYKLSGIAVIGAILILSVLISGCVNSGEKIVKEGDNVKVNITEGNITKTIFIENISAKGKKYPFEKDLIGMKVGGKRNISYEEVISVKLSQEPKPNTVYSAPTGKIKVFNVTDTKIYLANNPLAGETLKFHVTIKNISKNRAVECLAKYETKYNITPDTVIFYHADWCPHCRRMMPWVKNLTAQGYKFFWVEVEKNHDRVKIVKECASNIIHTGGGIPQFGCAANGKNHFGEFRSIKDMKNFAEECKKSAALLNKTNKAKVVKKGDFVVIEYVGRLANETIFENKTTGFTVGSGKVVRGLDKGIIGMKIGESKDIIVPPEEGYGLPRAVPKVMPQEIAIHTFKAVFNEEPVKGKEYTNLNILPWPVKVIDIKTVTHNITVEILETGNFSHNCFKEYGIDKGAVIFYHSNTCPHCKKMMPWVKELENKGYKFLWIEASDTEKMKIAKKCFSDVLKFNVGVPQFGCAANKKDHIGEFESIKEMKNFAEECNKSAQS